MRDRKASDLLPRRRGLKHSRGEPDDFTAGLEDIPRSAAQNPRPRPHLRLERCPVRDEAGRVLGLSRDLLAVLRRLRRSRRTCPRCAAHGRCLALDEFNLLVQQALQEVADEWEGGDV